MPDLPQYFVYLSLGHFKKGRINKRYSSLPKINTKESHHKSDSTSNCLKMKKLLMIAVILLFCAIAYSSVEEDKKEYNLEYKEEGNDKDLKAEPHEGCQNYYDPTDLSLYSVDDPCRDVRYDCDLINGSCRARRRRRSGFCRERRRRGK